MSRFWRLQLAGLSICFIWLVGTYILDWIGVPNWVNWAWVDLVGATWLIGGNVLYRRWRKQDL